MKNQSLKTLFILPIIAFGISCSDADEGEPTVYCETIPKLTQVKIRYVNGNGDIIFSGLWCLTKK